MRILSILSLALVAGCQALTRGASDGAAAGVTGGLPPVPGDGFSTVEAVGYTVAGVVAYVIGSLGKGYVRKKVAERDEEKS